MLVKFVTSLQTSPFQKRRHFWSQVLSQISLQMARHNANGLPDESKRAGLLQWFRSLTVVPDIV